MTKRRCIQLVFLVLTVGQCLFIFRMSAMPAVESADLSGTITYRVAKMLVGDLGHLGEAERMALIDLIDHLIRKMAHFAEYAVLGALLATDVWFVVTERRMGNCDGANVVKNTDGGAFATAWRCGGGWRLFFPAWLVGTLYAASDEWHQTFVAGRSGEVRDVMLDSAGVACGVFFTILLLGWMNRRSAVPG